MSSKKDELEKLIQDSYNIVRQNDQQILTADPRIQLRLQQENDKNWQYIKTYLTEYASLCEFRRLSALDDIIDIAATRFPDLAERLETAPQARQDTLTKHPAAPAPPPPASHKKDQNPLLKLFTKEQKESALLFGISYKFLHPYMASDREGLAQF